MERYGTLAGALVLLTLFVLCKPDESPKAREIAPTSEPAPADTVIHYESLMNSILILQEAITADPTTTHLPGRLLRLATDTVAGCFLSVGKGVPNPAMPESARTASVRRAAKCTGERWALYLKAWHTGKEILFGQMIKGKVVYGKVLYERLSADTLYALCSVPVGSVVLHR